MMTCARLCVRVQCARRERRDLGGPFGSPIDRFFIIPFGGMTAGSKVFEASANRASEILEAATLSSLSASLPGASSPSRRYLHQFHRKEKELLRFIGAFVGAVVSSAMPPANALPPRSELLREGLSGCSPKTLSEKAVPLRTELLREEGKEDSLVSQNHSVDGDFFIDDTSNCPSGPNWVPLCFELPWDTGGDACLSGANTLPLCNEAP